MTSERHIETFAEVDSPRIHIAAIQRVLRDNAVYGGGVEVLDKYLTVTIKPSSAKASAASLRELAGILASNEAGELGSHVADDTTGWAQIVSFLNDMGNVIIPSLRFQPLIGKGFSLTELQPRMVDRSLQFHFLEFSDEDGDYVVRRVSWDTESQEIHVVAVNSPI